MIVSSSMSDLLDHSLHRGLWSMLPARARRGLGALRPLAEAEAPRPACHGEPAAAAVALLALAAAQQWVWLVLLAVALAGTLASQRVLPARAARIAAARQKMKQNLMASEARARRLMAASAVALAACAVALRAATVVTMIIISSLFCFLASLCREKTKSINHNLIHRIFGQQLAGVAYI